MASRIGVDVGGTFTDLIILDEKTGKVVVGKLPSTPSAPENGVLAVVDASAGDHLGSADYFVHGTTVGLNALLERKGALVGLITTRGFRDVLEMRRSVRAVAYDQMWRAPEPLVPRNLRLEVTERTLADGTIDTPLSAEDVTAAAAAFGLAGVECIAVVLLNSHTNPANEIEVERILRHAGYAGDIALSHRVSGEYGEYERTSTTVVDSYVRPAVSGYLGRLSAGLTDRGFGGEYLISRSGGGASYFTDAAGRPFETIMSGPVGGVAGTMALCTTLGIANAIAADVGGTSFDTSLIVDGRPQVVYEGQVIGLPLQSPWIDVRSIGAGGGSIAYVEAGLLHVGPRSAGATPGPVCYGRGGTEPTVTDAAAVLGILGQSELAGGLSLLVVDAEAAIARLGDELGLSVETTAAGIIAIANAAMAGAIREITVERGIDPRDATLVGFGGAGPLFANLLASELGMSNVAVPAAAGNFSAWGLLSHELARSAGQTLIRRLDVQGLTEADEVAGRLLAGLQSSGRDSEGAILEPALDLRYVGQEHTITVQPRATAGQISAPWEDIATQFSDSHERLYGHRMEAPVEIVSVRATVRIPLPSISSSVSTDDAPKSRRSAQVYSFSRGGRTEFQVIDRASLVPGETFHGPAIITEPTTATYVDEEFTVRVHESGTLLLSAEKE
ncbi:hydantoinase/oxoprolinase family protein [soil metagenome]